ncbi:MarR family winged helix-turn-helix transcriptional regulator [Ammoniphilus sp. YIM 78166]|uniref:MarR family winged helix-turn-helix transcriptional regulator n=1 Tax=Ammoniphilus sp. YIM 78166 TaxID=1644106 RepID=UPI001F0DC975|nr:MarR family transcriptional regulator [Ammoniphilus sp. YIM 78166]
MEKLAKLLLDHNKLFMSIVTHELKKQNITIPQAIVIDTIKDEAKTIGDISKAIDLSYSTVSGIIDRLERDGLVERYRNETDRRVVWVRLTERCQDFHQTNPIVNPDFYREMFLGMSKEEEEGIMASLSILQVYFEQHTKSLNVRKGSES